MTKKISNKQHFENSAIIYSTKGFSAVCDYANKHKIGYEFCKACDSQSPSIQHICLACGSSTSKKYIVSVCRISYAFRDIEVEAVDENHAMRLAREEAGNHEFSEKSADYTADVVREK